MTARRLLWGLFVGAALAPTSLRAELILDDFNDPAILVSPNIKFRSEVNQNVGDLSAQRTLTVSTPQTPIGAFAADVIVDSALVASLEELITADPFSNSYARIDFEL